MAKKKKELQEVEVELIEMDLDRKIEANREVAYRANLILATALVASQGIASGKQPEEAAAYFSKTFERMQDWYSAKPLKEQIEQIIGTVLPERYY